jgi:hypothetical protein
MKKQVDKSTDPLNIENWYDSVKEYTFETEFIEISSLEAEALIAAYEDPNGKLGKYTIEYKILLLHLEKTLDQFIDSKIGAFIKLSSRSPKDAVFKLPHLPQLIQDAKKQGGMDKNLTITHIFHQALKVLNGKEAMFLLTNSQRIYHDLTSLLLESDKDHPFKLVLAVRKWIQIYPGFEFRGFVYQNKLNALTQYFETICVPELVKTKEFVQGRITTLFSKIGPLLKKLDNYVIDFCMLKDGKIMLIELNHFSPTTGTALFSKEDYNGLFRSGPLEFRIHEKDDEKVGEKMSKILSSMYEGTWKPTEEHDVTLVGDKPLSRTYIAIVVLIFILLPIIVNLFVKN